MGFWSAPKSVRLSDLEVPNNRRVISHNTQISEPTAANTLKLDTNWQNVAKGVFWQYVVCEKFKKIVAQLL